ncbi:MAG: helix-turn-helix domain-containing protein [Terracidiphilus sp.]|nr:helix-turn-helix domain-containing protein [Terracidiphilus sp.]
MKHYRFCPRCQFDLREAADLLHHSEQMMLPFAEKEYVDIKRAARIFGVSTPTVHKLRDAGLIQMINPVKHRRIRVRYQSIVDLCDKLRARYCIADRRPALDGPFLRHRDADLLPFPLTDSISVESAMQIMGYSSETPVYLMLEEGRFEAYRLLPKMPWRISRVSLGSYLQRICSDAKNIKQV